MLNRERIMEIMQDYPEVGKMSISEYTEYKGEQKGKLPCMTSIYKYFSRWVEFKLECFKNPKIHKWWKNENKVVKALLEHEETQYMTELEYDLYQEEHEVPSRMTIRKYLGTSFKEMKKKVFNGIDEEEVVVKPLECAYCLQEDSCPYDYDIKECKYY